MAGRDEDDDGSDGYDDGAEQMSTSEPGEWRVLTCSIIAWL